ncbi:hypothetical protein CLF_106791 [Clonorchis sinensis]|uniref:Uncharacterized protein n=1 Tax=Clonorchis sinensis TaxID=79923 RepID=G7YFQ1_CLOSI|nr:hypothetical protein CLF_106791 [Clonorchis sinensis]
MYCCDTLLIRLPKSLQQPTTGFTLLEANEVSVSQPHKREIQLSFSKVRQCSTPCWDGTEMNHKRVNLGDSCLPWSAYNPVRVSSDQAVLDSRQSRQLRGHRLVDTQNDSSAVRKVRLTTIQRDGSKGEMAQWLEREFTDWTFRGSNPTFAFPLPLSKLGQPEHYRASRSASVNAEFTWMLTKITARAFESVFVSPESQRSRLWCWSKPGYLRCLSNPEYVQTAVHSSQPIVIAEMSTIRRLVTRRPKCSVTSGMLETCVNRCPGGERYIGLKSGTTIQSRSPCGKAVIYLNFEDCPVAVRKTSTMMSLRNTHNVRSGFGNRAYHLNHFAAPHIRSNKYQSQIMLQPYVGHFISNGSRKQGAEQEAKDRHRVARAFSKSQQMVTGMGYESTTVRQNIKKRNDGHDDGRVDAACKENKSSLPGFRSLTVYIDVSVSIRSSLSYGDRLEWHSRRTNSGQNTDDSHLDEEISNTGQTESMRSLKDYTLHDLICASHHFDMLALELPPSVIRFTALQGVFRGLLASVHLLRSVKFPTCWTLFSLYTIVRKRPAPQLESQQKFRPVELTIEAKHPKTQCPLETRRNHHIVELREVHSNTNRSMGAVDASLKSYVHLDQSDHEIAGDAGLRCGSKRSFDDDISMCNQSCLLSEQTNDQTVSFTSHVYADLPSRTRCQITKDTILADACREDTDCHLLLHNVLCRVSAVRFGQLNPMEFHSPVESLFCLHPVNYSSLHTRSKEVLILCTYCTTHKAAENSSTAHDLFRASVAWKHHKREVQLGSRIALLAVNDVIVLFSCRCLRDLRNSRSHQSHVKFDHLCACVALNCVRRTALALATDDSACVIRGLSKTASDASNRLVLDSPTPAYTGNGFETAPIEACVGEKNMPKD